MSVARILMLQNYCQFSKFYALLHRILL